MNVYAVALHATKKREIIAQTATERRLKIEVFELRRYLIPN
jgi:hypothetical protein